MNKRGTKRSYGGHKGLKKPRLQSRMRRPARGNARTGGFQGMELKFVDYESASNAVVATAEGAEVDPATADSISAIAQGDGESQRDGRRCVLKHVQLQGQVQLDATNDAATAPNGGVVRVALVWDKQTNGAQLNSEDVYNATTSAAVDAYGFRNLQYSQRFQVLGVQYIDLNPMSASGTAASNDSGQITKFFSIRKRINIPVQFTGTTAVVASIADNSLHVIATKSDNSSTGMTLRYVSRVRFVG